MNSVSSSNSFCDSNPIKHSNNYFPTIAKSHIKNERKLLKVFLVSCLYKLFCDLYHAKFKNDLGKRSETTECYAMDSKIIEILILEIVETGEYTLEGIATYTRIPLDIIVDAACGISNKLSITPWARIVDLYMQVKPEVSKIFLEKIVETKDKYRSSFSSLLNEAL